MGAEVRPVPPYITPTEVVAETIPAFPWSGPFRDPTVNRVVLNAVPLALAKAKFDKVEEPEVYRFWMVVNPMFETEKSEVVAVWVELAISKRDRLVSPLLAWSDSLEYGELDPIPKLVPLKTKPAVSVRAVAPVLVWMIRLAVKELWVSERARKVPASPKEEVATQEGAPVVNEV